MGANALSDPNVKDLCKDILLDSYLPLFLTFFTGFITLIVNNLLRSALYRLAGYSRYKSASNEQSSVMVTVFIAQFLNTALIPFFVVYKWSDDFKPGKEFQNLISTYVFDYSDSFNRGDDYIDIYFYSNFIF